MAWKGGGRERGFNCGILFWNGSDGTYCVSSGLLCGQASVVTHAICGNSAANFAEHATNKAFQRDLHCTIGTRFDQRTSTYKALTLVLAPVRSVSVLVNLWPICGQILQEKQP